MLKVMDEQQTESEYGCFFCRTGYESQTAQEIERLLPMSNALVPIKLHIRRINGKPCEESMPLFPGYVFVRTDSGCNLFQECEHRYVYRVLCDAEHNWHLRGNDASVVAKLFGAKGVIDYSAAYYENDRLRITDGFLKDYEGDIVRVDRRSHAAQIRLKLLEKEVKVWLGFELLEKSAAYERKGTDE